MDFQEELALQILEIAAEDSPLGQLSALVEVGVSLEKKDEGGRTALHFASLNGNVENVIELLENGADASATTDFNATTLHMAASQRDVELLKLFIKKGVNVNHKDKAGCTALHVASDYGIEGNVKHLLDNGADINTKNDLDETAFHIACIWGCPGSVKILLNKGANVDVKNNHQQTCVHLAARNQMDGKAILEIVLEMGLDVDAKDVDGWAPLHSASVANNIDCVKLLVERLAYIDAKNGKGRTPLHQAVKYRHYNIVMYLLLHGASVGIRDKYGETAYDLMMIEGEMYHELDHDVEDEVYNFYLEAKHQFTIQFLKMKLLQIPVDEYVMDIGRDVLKEIPKLEEEVRRIKSTHVAECLCINTFTLYDLVLECDKPLFLQDLDLAQRLETLLFSPDFFSTFPEYGYILRTRFFRAKRSRSHLTSLAVDSVYNVKRQSWCDVTQDVWNHIFSFLRKDDLKSFIKSVEDGVQRVNCL